MHVNILFETIDLPAVPVDDEGFRSFVQFTEEETEFVVRLWNRMSYSIGSFSVLVVREVVCKINITFNNDVPARNTRKTTRHTRPLQIPFFRFAMVKYICTKQRTSSDRDLIKRRRENQYFLKRQVVSLKIVHLSNSRCISKLFSVLLFQDIFCFLSLLNSLKCLDYKWKFSEADGLSL